MKKRAINNGTLEIYDLENKVILSILEKIDEDVLTIKLKGQIITETAHEFEDELFACVTVYKKIVIDFENVLHISSMGLNTLLEVQKILDNENDSFLKLINVSDEVYKDFNSIGFDELFLIEKKNKD